MSLLKAASDWKTRVHGQSLERRSPRLRPRRLPTEIDARTLVRRAKPPGWTLKMVVPFQGFSCFTVFGASLPRHRSTFCWEVPSSYSNFVARVSSRYSRGMGVLFFSGLYYWDLSFLWTIVISLLGSFNTHLSSVTRASSTG